MLDEEDAEEYFIHHTENEIFVEHYKDSNLLGLDKHNRTYYTLIMSKKTMPLEDLPAFIQESVQAGCSIETVVRKNKRVIARLNYRMEPEDKDVVRIPCLIVPQSPFHKRTP